MHKERGNGLRDGQGETRSCGDIIRSAYAALRIGDMATLMSFIAEDVRIDRPALRLWGNHQRGRDYFSSVIGKMAACADIEITGSRIFEGEGDVAATLAYTLTARNSGETLAVEIVEIFGIENGLVTHIDVYDKDPELVSAFLARAETGLERRM